MSNMEVTMEFIEQALEKLKREIFANLHVAVPGTVLAYDEDSGRADIQPGLRKETQSGQLMTAPVLRGVPVVGLAEEDRISPGDKCLVVFADFCTDGFLQTGREAVPPSPREHDLSDGFAFVGFR